jgi:hypothetical protein
MILVLDKGADALGLMIDGFPLALRGLRPAHATVPLPPRLAPFAHGLSTNDAGIWVEFDHKGLFRALADQGLQSD